MVSHFGRETLHTHEKFYVQLPHSSGMYIMATVNLVGIWPQKVKEDRVLPPGIPPRKRSF